MPRKGSAGHSYYKLQVAYQIPDQDIDLKHCLYVRPEFVCLFHEIARQRSEGGLDVAVAQEVADEDRVSIRDECVQLSSGKHERWQRDASLATAHGDVSRKGANRLSACVSLALPGDPVPKVRDSD